MVGLSEGDMCYQIYCSATKEIIQAPQVTFIQDNDEQLYVDEERMDFSEKTINLQPKSNNNVGNANVKNQEIMKPKVKQRIKKQRIVSTSDEKKFDKAY